MPFECNISYDYMKNESNLIEYDTDKKLKEMEEVLELGWKLIDNVAYNKSSRFEDEHRTIKLKFCFISYFQKNLKFKIQNSNSNSNSNYLCKKVFYFLHYFYFHFH